MRIKVFNCPDCSKSFRTEGGMNHHREVVHGADREPGVFDCPVCRKTLWSSAALENHKRSSHPEPKLPVGRRPTLAEINPTCLECGEQGALVSGDKIYPHRPDLYAKKFYLCACGAYCGCHPNSVVPLGHPCGPETRRARNAAHAAFDPIWRSRRMSRASAYKWLADQLGIDPAVCHIGMMTAERARRVVEIVNAAKLEAA